MQARTAEGDECAKLLDPVFAAAQAKAKEEEKAAQEAEKQQAKAKKVEELKGAGAGRWGVRVWRRGACAPEGRRGRAPEGRGAGW